MTSRGIRGEGIAQQATPKGHLGELHKTCKHKQTAITKSAQEKKSDSILTPVTGSGGNAKPVRFEREQQMGVATVGSNLEFAIVNLTKTMKSAHQYRHHERHLNSTMSVQVQLPKDVITMAYSATEPVLAKVCAG